MKTVIFLAASALLASSDAKLGLFNFNERNLQDATSPTPFPTVLSTTFPTALPTTSPSFMPTSSPTMSPTMTPTSTPTMYPTTKPTDAPTLLPTVSPSWSPTMTPTKSPIMKPTTQPTDAPSFIPTVSPTSAPTNIPSEVNASMQPSVVPTSIPTAVGNENPIPTVSPSSVPTVSENNNTMSPTSSVPTSFPTNTGETNFPSVAPSSFPTTNTPTTSYENCKVDSNFSDAIAQLVNETADCEDADHCSSLLEIYNLMLAVSAGEGDGKRWLAETNGTYYDFDVFSECTPLDLLVASEGENATRSEVFKEKCINSDEYAFAYRGEFCYDKFSDITIFDLLKSFGVSNCPFFAQQCMMPFSWYKNYFD